MKNKIFNFLILFIVISICSYTIFAVDAGKGAKPTQADINNQWFTQINGGLEGTKPDLYTGDMSYSIPVMTVPGRGGLDFPISLNYKAGVTVKQDASWIGLGWSFNPGAIVRSVVGAPDDYKNDEMQGTNLNSYSIGFGLFYQNREDMDTGAKSKLINVIYDPYSQYAQQDINNQVRAALAEPENQDLTGIVSPNLEFIEIDPPGYLYEGKVNTKQEKKDLPDAYYTPFGKMVLVDVNGQKKFHLYNPSSELDVNGNDAVKIDYTSDNNGLIDSFTITLTDSTRYVFNKPVRISKCSKFDSWVTYADSPMRFDGWGYMQVNRPDADAVGDYMAVQYVDHGYGQGTNKGYAMDWMLTAILSPDYSDVNNNGPDSADNGNWIKFNYQMDYQDFHTKMPYVVGNIWQNGMQHDEIGENLYYDYYADGMLKLQSSVSTRNYQCNEIYHLDNIETPTHIAEFSAEMRDDMAEYDAMPMNQKTFEYKAKAGERRPMKLNEIRLYNKNDLNKELGIVELEQTYELHKNQPYNINNKNINQAENNDGKLTLKKIKIWDVNKEESLPPYEFEYNDNPSYKIYSENCRQWPDSDDFGLTYGVRDENNNPPLDYYLDCRYDNFGYFWEDGKYFNHNRLDGHFKGVFGIAGYTGTSFSPGIDYYFNEYDQTVNGFYNNNRESMQDADAWSLKKIKLPTGGLIEWEYETDTFSSSGPSRTDKEYDFCSTLQQSPYGGAVELGRDAGSHLCNNKADHFGGGIRVKSVKMYDNIKESPIQIDYFYKDIDYDNIQTSLNNIKMDNINFGRSSGTVAYPPHWRWIKTNGMVPDYVGYSSVIERVMNDDKTYSFNVYKFSSPEDAPIPIIKDDGSEKSSEQIVSPENVWKYDWTYYGDKSSRWGHLMSKTSYDKNLNKIAETNNEYSFASQTQVLDLIKPGGFMDFQQGTVKVLPEWVKLVKTTAMQDGFSVVNEIEYNNKNGAQEKTTAYKLGQADNTKKKKSESKFAYEVYPDMDANHMWSQPYEIYLKDGNGKIFSASRTTYLNSLSANNAWYPYQNKVWENDNVDSAAKTTLSDNDFNLVTSTINSYDKWGNILKSTDANGFSTYNVYDDVYHAYLLKLYNDISWSSEETPLVKNEYYPNGLLKSIEDRNGFKVYTSYDNFNRPVKTATTLDIVNSGEDLVIDGIKFKSSSITEYRLDGFPKSVKTTVKIDNTLKAEAIAFFDGLGRNIQTKIKKDSSNYIVAETSYLESGQVDKQYEPKEIRGDGYSAILSTDVNEFTRTRYNSDPLARVAAVCPQGTSEINCNSALASNQLGIVQTYYGSNNNGFIVGVVDENNNWVQSVTDEFGNLIEIYTNDNPSIKNIYKYNLAGNLKTQNLPLDSSHTQIISNEYDSLNRLKKNAHPDTGITAIDEYDNVGNIKESTDAKDYKTKYYYDDALNRLTKVEFLSSDGTKVIETSNTYDTNCLNNNQYGVLCKTVHKDITRNTGATYTYGYDKKSRIIQQKINIKGLGKDIEYYLSYEYDFADNIKQISFEDKKIIYRYNNLNQLEKVEFFDGKSTAEIAAYEYNPESTIKEIVFGSGAKTDYAYTNRNWLESLDTKNSEVLFQRSYDYDEVGNIDKLYNGADKNNLLADFDYDQLDRLTTVDDNNYYGSDISYTYDKIGNRQTQILGTISTQYDYGYEDLTRADSNILTSVNGMSIGYDLSGNMIDYGNKRYIYDVLNRLIKVDTTGDGVYDNEYVYDSSGMRVMKKDSNGVTAYVYDINGNNIYEEKVASSSSLIAGSAVKQITSDCNWWNFWKCW